MIRALFTVAALALVALAAGGSRDALAGGGCHADTGVVTDEATTNVDLTAACFQPMVVRVDEGATVTWTNRDTMTHTITGVAQSFGNYDELRLDDTLSATFENAGVFPYYCALHPSMVGAVVVGDGVPAGSDDTAAAITSTDSGGDGGTSTSTIAGIIAAIGVAGAAVGLVGSRVLASRRTRKAVS